MNNEYEIVKFIDNNFELDVRADKDNDTVWLSQKDMASLFDVSTDNIGLHIKNIFKDNELDISTTEESSVVQHVYYNYLKNGNSTKHSLVNSAI